MLRAEGLGKDYHDAGRTVTALAAADVSADPGQFIAVHGPSGSGKTTLLLMLGGLLRPSQGRVLVDGVDVYSLSHEQRARFRAEKIGFVFQEFHLLPYLSVLDNVLACTLAKTIPDAEVEARQLLKRFGLEERADHKPEALSSGERQRTALARALLAHPSIILADEPTGNLDEENGALVLDDLLRLAREGNIVILATHDSRAAQHADQILEVIDGRTVQNLPG